MGVAPLPKLIKMIQQTSEEIWCLYPLCSDLSKIGAKLPHY